MIRKELGIVVEGVFSIHPTEFTYCRHFSDINKKILQLETNIIYDEAVDIYPCHYTYIETQEEIDYSTTE